MLRSILTIATCVVLWGIAWVAANTGLAQAFPGKFDAHGVTTDPALLLVFIAVCVMLCFAAGWLCGRLVSRAPMKHVAVLGLIQLGIGIMVQASVWDLMPVWYHLSFLATVVPMHLIGGWMGLARRAGRDPLPGAVGARA